MAELWIQTLGNEVSYEDGDVFTLISDKQISWSWLSHFANIRSASFTVEGLRPSGFHQLIRETFCVYKFERLTLNTVKRTNQLTSQETIITDGVPFMCPDVNRSCVLNIRQYIKERRKNPAHQLFGTEGKEIWYSDKKRNLTTYRLNLGWNVVETHTPNRKEDHQNFGAGKGDKTNRLLVTTNNPEKRDQEAYLNTVSANGQVVWRPYHVPWRDLHGIGSKTIDRMERTSETVDIRGFDTFIFQDIIQDKGL